MAHLGDYFIYTATACATVSLVLYFLAWRGRDRLPGLARKFYAVVTVFLVAAVAVLLYLILTHDFSVIYVFSYSSTDLNLYYLISTLWAGQEGTLLLWVMLTAVAGAVMIRKAGSFEQGNMFWVNLFLLLILAILIKKSPFELMPVFRAEGNGLNPLLLNFWMTIHPPIMFVGYAAALIPFAYALTALVERRYDVWAEAARRWTIFAWGTIGVSIVMGCYWSYETLGWGGYWAWDPVENASLIPWIFLTAQIHILFVKRQRQGLMRFSLVMVLLSFWSVLYGTFLTRSGVLADFSVHSFVDLGINRLLVGGLLLFVVIGVFLLAVRWRDITTRPSFAAVASRTYLTTLGIVILFVGALLVLLGTSAPIITRVTSNPSAVDIDYYSRTMAPVAVVLLVLVALSPAFRWRKGVANRRILIAGALVFVVTVVVLPVAGVTDHIVYLLLFGFGLWALLANGWAFVRSIRAGGSNAGYLSHVGLALFLIGATASTGLETKATVTLPADQTVSALGYDLTFTDMVDTERGFDCYVEVVRGKSHFTGKLAHEFYRNSEEVMRKPDIERRLAYDLYLSPVALENARAEDSGTVTLSRGRAVSVVVELSKKPLIQLLWLGAIVVFIGGLMAIGKTNPSTGERQIPDGDDED